jgi:hypothetical protein
MRKLLIGCIAILTATLVVGCRPKSHDGTYTAIIKGEYSVAEDTLIIKGNIVTKRTGFRRIIDGKLKQKQWTVERWILNGTYSPIIELGDDQITLGSTTYKHIK